MPASVQSRPTPAPDSAALRAATLSFAAKLPPQPPRKKSSALSVSSLSSVSTAGSARTRRSASQTPARRSNPNLRPQPSSRSLAPSLTGSTAGAALAAARFASPAPSPTMSEDVLPAGGTVQSRKQLFQAHPGAAGSPGPASPPSPTKVDASSIEDIHALKHRFEVRGAASASAIYSPKPVRATADHDASRTAAVLATKLSPPGSQQSSRPGSPDHDSAYGPSIHTSPSVRSLQLLAQSAEGARAGAGPARAGPPPVKKKPPGIAAAVSKESPKPEEARSSALTAATVAVSRTPQPPPTPTPPTPQPPPAQAAKPTPPPPRRQRSIHLTPTPAADPSSDGESVYATPDTSPHVSRITSRTSPPPPPPSRKSTSAISLLRADSTSLLTLPTRGAPALPPRTSSVRPTTSYSTPHLPLAPAHSGSSAVTAASLAPARAQAAAHTAALERAEKAAKKHPAPTPPPARRRRSSLPTTGAQKPILRETLRKSRSRSRSRSPSPKKAGHGALHKSHGFNEAARARWRQAVGERERRRYEGLWAAQRGTFLPAAQRDFVANVVVRDVWRRSRLSQTTLAAIWELVDRRGVGALDREEFVVGTWLVDQSLRGRKVPTRLGEDVWASVRRMGVSLEYHRGQRGKGR